MDVAYLDAVINGAGYPIFPYDDSESVSGGSGDCDGNAVTDPADVTYLMNYLMGGAPPIGAWRFGFMP